MKNEVYTEESVTSIDFYKTYYKSHDECICPS